jgi:hypothetical protein
MQFTNVFSHFICYLFTLLTVFFFSIGDQTQGLAYAKQAPWVFGFFFFSLFYKWGKRVGYILTQKFKDIVDYYSAKIFSSIIFNVLTTHISDIQV